jgi:branched-chain amino acid transport system permease protein
MTNLLQSPNLLQSRWLPAVVTLVLVAATLVLGPGPALLITEVAVMALFASSLGFLINYGGMVSFGHAAYFGLGAYGFALSVAKLGLPLWVAVICGPLTAALGALLFGALCVRLTHIYFAMLTLACSEIVFTGLFQAYDYTGGDNGITSFMSPRFGLTPQVYGAATIAVVALCIALLARIVRSPLGLAIQAVGEEPHRAAALGFSPRTVQLTAFVIAGTLAGIAGTMYSVFHGNAFPDYAGIGITVDALVMVVIGGVKSFYGGVVGAIIYVLLKTFVSRAFSHWELVIGLILIAVVLVFPAGITGLLQKLGLSRPIEVKSPKPSVEART